MDKATLVFSRKGLFKVEVNARDIKSHEHARKLWPLVNPDNKHQLVTWVKPSFEDDELLRRSHFRLLPSFSSLDVKGQFEKEESQREKSVQESVEHRTAKKLIALELESRLSNSLSMPWYYKDHEASDFHFEGNLLLGAEKISVEHFLPTPFGSKFRLDIAVIGAPIQRTPVVLGGIEIESTHAFDGRKALIAKSLGFPLISIDISKMSLVEITQEWAKNILSKTTLSHANGKRQTYVYLHEIAFPTYAKFPIIFDRWDRHQFLIFADDVTLRKLSGWLVRLGEALNFDKHVVAIALVNAKSEQSRKMLDEAGKVVGAGWEQLNPSQCLRVTIPRPRGFDDLQSHRFHITMARLLLSNANALVGYKYCLGLHNNAEEEDIWVHREWLPDQQIFEDYRILPKRLAEPMSSILQIAERFQTGAKREAKLQHASIN